MKLENIVYMKCFDIVPTPLDKQEYLYTFFFNFYS